MLKVSGVVTVRSSSGRNLVLNQGIERFLGGERIWDLVQECSLGEGTRGSRPFHDSLEAPLGISAPASKSERFDKDTQTLIMEVKASFPGPLKGVREIGWGDSKGLWNRITVELIEGFPAVLDIAEDEFLEVTLEVQISQVKRPLPVKVYFEGKEFEATVESIGLDNPLAWSAEGIGSNKGLGWWGNHIKLIGETEAESLEGELVPYSDGDFNRELEIYLGPTQGNLAGGIKAIQFGTSHEGLRNAHYLWQLTFKESFQKTPNSKVWLNFSWAIMRG